MCPILSYHAFSLYLQRKMRVNNKSAQTVLAKKEKESMKELTSEMAMLERQIQRYQRLRNGVMCQQLKQKLLKLKAA